MVNLDFLTWNDLQDTVDCIRKWLVDLSAGKLTLFHLIIQITRVLLMQIWIGLSLMKNQLLNMLLLSCLCYQNCLQKIGVLIHFMYPFFLLRLLFKVCVCYIFASLFFKSKGEHLWNKENCILFHFKSSCLSWNSQILTFQIFKCHLLINLGSKHSLVMKCNQLM